MQQFPELGNPYGRTETLRRAIEGVIRLWFTSGGEEVEADLLLRAILEETGSDAVRALAQLGVSREVMSGAMPAPATPRPRRDVVMVRFSSPASTALGFADRNARSQGRPTTTGDAVAELLDADHALAAR